VERVSLAKKHRKLMIFTTPSLVRWYADVFLHEGITVGAYSDYISTPSMRVLEAFNAIDRAVLVVSSELAADWNSEAPCIALCDLTSSHRRTELFGMIIAVKLRKSTSSTAASLRPPSKPLPNLSRADGSEMRILDRLTEHTPYSVARTRNKIKPHPNAEFAKDGLVMGY
jgi:hypothetical protein